MARIQPNNWHELQHYKDRDPSWIKLHKKLLDNYEFHCLPVASRALAPMLWLVASDSKEGIIDADPKKLGYRLRMTPKEVTDALNPLIDGGFFCVLQDASEPLAEAERLASLEEENKRREEEEENKRAFARHFETFWDACPKKVAKPKAKASFRTALASAKPEELIAAMRRYAQSRAGEPEKFTLHPTTWLNQQRWLDDGIAPKATLDVAALREQRERAARLNLPTDRIDRAIEEAEARAA